MQEISSDPIKIFINSQGGHVEASDTLHDMIKFIKPRVVMIGTGWVARAGFLVSINLRRYCSHCRLNQTHQFFF
ncbi:MULTISPECIES: ATP-dependent Clp protease proteolytic subunit [Xenorhabdus]|uniref:ATP-dependent Clp protease proteolytic subunit n=1 Tax=Xenorhabdus TaxID=626 RepID=UPI0035156E93